MFRGAKRVCISPIREPTEPGACVTVGAVLRFLRAAEERLRALGPTSVGSPICVEKPQANLIAAVYSYHLGTNRISSRFDEEALRAHDRRLTEALLLQVAGVSIVDHHEARLRKDLTNTLRDLAELQDRRRASRSGSGVLEERIQLADELQG